MRTKVGVRSIVRQGHIGGCLFENLKRWISGARWCWAVPQIWRHQPKHACNVKWRNEGVRTWGLAVKRVDVRKMSAFGGHNRRGNSFPLVTLKQRNGACVTRRGRNLQVLCEREEIDDRVEAEVVAA